LPLTPKGNATERHIVTAIDKKAREINGGNSEKLAAFWADKLRVSSESVSVIADTPAELQELIRSKLMKYGTPGYVFPEKSNFPVLEEVIRFTEESGALPAATWLDGTNEGEKNIKELLRFLIKKGIALLNIIPDRNWNIKDGEERKTKVRNLHEVIRIAGELDLPVIAGTEMNKAGQRFIDDFTAPELSPYLENFRRGAFFVYDHTKKCFKT
jgi:hypothetical protein